jgi:hypothetical protein
MSSYSAQPVEVAEPEDQEFEEVIIPTDHSIEKIEKVMVPAVMEPINSPGYNTRIAKNIAGAKLFQFFFKKGHTIRNIVIEAPDFDVARKDAEKIALHFGVRYVSVRPFVFSVDELLKLTDLPNYV